MSNQNLVHYQSIRDIIVSVLEKEGVDPVSAGHVGDGLVHASLRGVDSHGIRLLPHYLNALKAGRINPKPEYVFNKSFPSTATLDADNSFGHAAGMAAVEKSVEMAKETGIGAVSVKNSSHFGAASFYSLEIARKDMIGLSFTHADSLIIPTHGKRRFLGNNPICFTAPCENEEPVCLDMATSAITFNEILRHREENKIAPKGVGADKDGNETTNPHDIVSLLPVGDYKGYGLSLMVEVLCAILSGMPSGPEIPRMYDAPIEEKRNLGQFFMAINVSAFETLNVFKNRMQHLADSLRKEPSIDPSIPVMVAGDPEKIIEKDRKRNGIPLRSMDLDFFKTLSIQYNLSWELQ